MFGPDEKERFLCPVRAVIVYKSRTPDGAYAAGDHTLLCHPSPGVTTKKSVVALWIRQCITKAYDAAQLDSKHANAHKVRAVAHYLCLYKGATLEEVCEGGRWSSKQSFFNHYVRSMDGTSAGSASLPAVAGGQILT